jgi:hypothetical protein
MAFRDGARGVDARFTLTDDPVHRSGVGARAHRYFATRRWTACHQPHSCHAWTTVHCASLSEARGVVVGEWRFPSATDQIDLGKVLRHPDNGHVRRCRSPQERDVAPMP